MNDYLHFIGLTSSRQTALQAMETLGSSAERNIKRRMAKNYNLRPFMTLDNIDIQARIHNPRIEATTKLFHGSYGYLHFLPPHLLNEINPIEATTENLHRCIHESQSERFETHMLLPDQEGSEHWTKVLKAQIAKVYLDYEVEPDSPEYNICKESLVVEPPSVERIPMYTPDLVMLKMMNASDNSAVGVSEMMDQCLKQTGEDPIKFSKNVRVVEGDMGTCLNFESLVRQRFAAGHQDEALTNILNMPGLAHTMWNMGSRVLAHHWGDSKGSFNTGVHRTAGTLGMKTDKLTSQQDFNLLMHFIHKSHTATIVFLLRFDFNHFKFILIVFTSY